jgi:predicted nucleotidyltransferase
MAKRAKRIIRRHRVAQKSRSGRKRRIDKLLKDEREEILYIAARHGVENLRVFGSVARGEAILGSDVDFLVDVGPNRSPFFPGGLVADLEDLLGCRVDVVTEEGLHWYIREQVVREAKPL